MSLLESFWRRTCSRSSCLSCFYAHASHEGNGRNCTPRRSGNGPFHETRNVYKCHSCDPQNRWKASRPSPSNAFLGRGQGRYQRQVGPGPRARTPVFNNKINKIQSKCNNIIKLFSGSNDKNVVWGFKYHKYRRRTMDGILYRRLAAHLLVHRRRRLCLSRIHGHRRHLIRAGSQVGVVELRRQLTARSGSRIHT